MIQQFEPVGRPCYGKLKTFKICKLKNAYGYKTAGVEVAWIYNSPEAVRQGIRDYCLDNNIKEYRVEI